MAGITLTYSEVSGIKAFLGYLHRNYSKQINANDNLLIAAVGAWLYQESGGLRNVIGNNPFNIRDSPLQSGSRQTKNGNGHFAVFASIAKGFEAAAYLLMHGGHGSGSKDQDLYGYRLILNALKNGGNQAAYDFMAALAMSKWDAGHYGVKDWQDAYSKHNHLVAVYRSITGLQLQDPHPKAKKVKPRPQLPRDFNYNPTVRSYIDPYVARDRYAARHKRQSLGVDGPRLLR